MPIDTNLANWNKENGQCVTETPKETAIQTTDSSTAHQWRGGPKLDAEATDEYIRIPRDNDEEDEETNSKYMEELLDLCGWYDDEEKPPPKSYLKKSSSVDSAYNDSDDDDEVYWNHRDSEETLTDFERKWATSSSTIRRKSSTRLDLTGLSLKSKIFESDEEELAFVAGSKSKAKESAQKANTETVATTAGGRKPLSPITNTSQPQTVRTSTTQQARSLTASTTTLTRKTTTFGYDLEDEFDWANFDKMDRQESQDSGVSFSKKATFAEDFWGDMESVVF